MVRTTANHGRRGHGTVGDHEHPPLHPPPLAPGDPGPGALKEVKGPLQAAFLSDGRQDVTLRPTRNPSPRASFGFVGRAFRIDGQEETFPEGTLAMGLPHRLMGSVAPETVRVFRWEEGEDGYELVAASGLGQTGDYVWAQLTRPGIYALIGVNADPLVARALALLAFLGGWPGRSDTENRAQAMRSVCELILCTPEVWERVRDDDFSQSVIEDNVRMGLPGTWLPGRKLGTRSGKPNPCEVCLEVAIGVAERGPTRLIHPPELGLLEIHLTPSSQVGRWDVLPGVPAPADTVLAVHAALLRTGRVVFFGGSENVETQHDAGGASIDNTCLWDPTSMAIDRAGSPANHDLFCCGHAFLPDGRLLAAGGTQVWGGRVVGADPHDHAAYGHFRGLRNATVFDPGTGAGANPWSSVAPMRLERGKTTGGGRWYPTLLTLADGRVVAVSGHPEETDTRHNNTMLEAFTPAPAPQGGWADVGEQGLVPEGYPRMHLLPNGRVFFVSLGDGRSWTWDPSASPATAWTQLSTGPGPEYASYDSTSVLLPLLPAQNYRPRVLVMNKPQAKLIDLGAAAPAWQPTAARTLLDSNTGQPPVRYHATSVLLPDATVLLVGGHSNPLNWYPPVLAAERFDPTTRGWSTMATAAVPRVYHSVALLLPDGRVWTAGSDYGGGSHEPRMEVYTPPYLFWGPRPGITSAPSTLSPGTSFEVETHDARPLTSAALLRCGSSTHAFNPDQRYVGLEIQQQKARKLTLVGPPDRNVAPPGYYLLFVLDRKSVPSVGRFIRVN
jgi:hypothetical protein